MIERGLRRLTREGIERGWRGGSAVWLGVGIGAWLLRRATRERPAKVQTERLRPGDRILVTHLTERRGDARRNGRRGGVPAQRSLEGAGLP